MACGGNQKHKERRRDFTLCSLHRELVSFPSRGPPSVGCFLPLCALVGTQQAHLRAFSTSAVVVYSVFHVSYWGSQRGVCNHPAAV